MSEDVKSAEFDVVDETEEVAAVQSESSDDSSESERLTWGDRIERDFERAESGDESIFVRCVVNAIKTEDFHECGDFRVAELWTTALRRRPETALSLWEGLRNGISSTREMWQQVAEAHKIAAEEFPEHASVLNEALGKIELLRSGEAASGKSRLSGSGNDSAMLISASDVAETGNWRKVEQVIEEYFRSVGLDGDGLESAKTHVTADIALGQGALDRATELLRRASRKLASDRALQWRLAMLYRDSSKWNAYVDILKEEVEHEADLDVKTDIYLEMVRVYSEEMKLDTMVVKTYEALLASDPGNEQAFESLLASYERMRRWPDLVNLLNRQAEESAEVSKKIALYLRVANVYLSNLSRKVDAIKYFEEVLALVPDHDEAIGHLKALYEERREWEKLIDVHRREIAKIGDSGERIERLRGVADLAKTRLRSNAIAITVWESILDEDPGNSEALEHLEALYEAEKRFGDAARIGEIRAEAEDDAQERLKLWQKIGQTYSDRAGDNVGAIRAWRKVLEIDPAYAKGVESLKKLLIEERDWQALEDYYVETEGYEAFVKLCEQLSRTLKDSAAVKDILYRTAEVYERELSDRAGCKNCLERVLEIDETDAKAAGLLVPFFEAHREWEKLARAWTILRASTEDVKERSYYGVKLGLLGENKLDDPDFAYSHFYETVKEDPYCSEAYDGLQRVCDTVGFSDRVLALYESHAERFGAEDETLRRMLKYRIGYLYLEYLDRAEEARVIFKDLLDLEPENLKVLGALERIFEKAGKYDELLEINSKRLDLARTPEEEAETRLSSARIYEEHLDDTATAIASYERVRQLLPEDDRPLRHLHRLYRDAKEFESLAAVIERRLELLGVKEHRKETRREVVANEEGCFQIVYGATLIEGEDGGLFWLSRTYETVDPDVVVPLWFELGQVYQNELYDYEKAVRNYARIVSVDVEHEATREALEKLLEAEVENVEVSRILSQIYATKLDYEQLVKALAVLADSVSRDKEKVSYLLHAAAILGDVLNDIDGAFARYHEALTIFPESILIRGQLNELAEAHDAWRSLADIYELVTDEIRDDALKTQYDMQLFDYYESKLSNAERAVQYGRRALKRSESDAELLNELESRFVRLDAWSDVVGVLEARCNIIEDPEEIIDIRLRIAAICEEYLGQRSEAVDVYLDILDRKEDNVEALDALDRLYAELERWEDAAGNFERRLMLSEEGEVRDDFNCRLAEVLSEKLDDKDRAAELFEGVLSHDPSNEKAIAGLESILQSGEGYQVERVSEILLPVYDERGDWQKRIRVNEELLRVVTDRDRRRDLLHENADLYESRGADAENAFACYARSLQEDPENELTIEKLYTYADVLGKWSDLVDVMEASGEACDDPIQCKALLVRVAAIRYNYLNDPEASTLAYEKALEIDNEDPEILGALETIYTDRSMWRELSKILVTKARLSTDPTERKSLLFRASTLNEEVLNNVDEAIELLKEVLNDQAAEPNALDALERLYRSQEQWDELLGIYNAKIDIAEDDATRKDYYYKVGALQEGEANDLFGAVESYRQILTIDPSDPTALEALDRLFLATEDWQNLLDTLRVREEIAQSDEAIDFRFRQAEIHYRKLEDPLSAIEHYRSVLERNPQYAQAVAALEEIIAKNEGGVEDAARVLEVIYRGLQSYRELVKIYEVLLGLNEDDVYACIDMLKTIVTIEEELLDDPKAAYNAQFKALAKDVMIEENWEVAERLAATCDCWEDFAAKGEALLSDLSADGEQSIVIAKRLSGVYENILRQPQKAIEMMVRILEIDSTNFDAVTALDRLYESEQQWLELTEILKTRIDISTEDVDRVSSYYRLGSVYESCLENYDEAVNCYNEMLMIFPGQPDATESLVRVFESGHCNFAIAEILEPIYRETESWEHLISLDVSLLPYLETHEEKYDKLLEIADIYIEKLGDTENALTIYGNALYEKPGDDLALSKIEEYSEILQDWESAVAYYARAIEASDDDFVKQQLTLLTASTYDHKIEDFRNAEEQYLQVLKYDEEHSESLAALDRIYTAQQRFEDLAAILRREIAVVPGDEERRELMMRLGTLLNDMLSRPEDAIVVYNEVLAIDPADTEALSRLENIHASLEQWDALFNIYEQQSAVAADSRERAEIWSKMAVLAGEVLGKDDDAIDLWYQIIDSEGDSINALAQLEALFVRGQRYQDISDVLERQIPLCEPESQELLDCYKKLGRLWQANLEDDERALQYWRDAFAVDRTDLETLHSIRAIDEKKGDKEDLAETLRHLLQTGKLTLEEQIECSVYLAETLDKDLGRPEEAVEMWLYVVELDTKHHKALAELERLYTESELWREVANVKAYQSSASEDPQEAYDLLMVQAKILEEKCEDVPAAAEVFVGILNVDYNHQDTFRKLVNLYTRHENWEDLFNAYVDRSEIVEDPEERLQLLLHAADVSETRLNNPRMGFSILQGALAEHWRDQRLADKIEHLAEVTDSWQELVRLYEGLIERNSERPQDSLSLHNSVAKWYFLRLNDTENSWSHFQYVQSLDPDNISALSALAEIYTKLGNWDELTQTLLRLFELTTKTDDRVSILMELASVWEEKYNDAEQAVTTYKEALKLNSARVDVMEQLARIFEERQDWNSLIDMLEKQSSVLDEDSDDIEKRVSVRFRAASVYEHALEQYENAVKAYIGVIALDAQHVDALIALERLYAQLEKWEELLSVYDRQLETFQENHEQIDIYAKIAQVYENYLAQPDKAIDSMKQILMIEPENFSAMAELERMYDKYGQWEPLLEILQVHIQALPDGNDHVELLRKLGEVYRDQYQDSYQAIESYLRLTSIAPNDGNALMALADLYHESEDYISEIDMLSKRVASLEEPSQAIDLQYRIGRVYLDNLDDDFTAEERFRIALDLDMGHMPTIDALVLVYRQREDWQSVLRMLKQKVEYTRELDQKAELFYELGHICEHNLGDSYSAYKYYEESLALKPHHIESARKIADKCYESKEWARALLLYQTVIEGEAFNPHCTDLYLLNFKAGDCYQKLEQHDKALQAFRASYELDQNYFPTLLGMGQQLFIEKDYERAHNMFQNVLNQYREHLTPEQITQIYFDIAVIQKHTGAYDVARQYLERILETEGFDNAEKMHKDCIDMLIAICEEQQDWQSLIYYKELKIQTLDDANAKFSELKDIAQIYASLNNNVGVVTTYLKALEIDPESKFVLTKLLRIYDQQKEWNNAIGILNRLCELESSPEKRATYYYTIAFIYKDEIGDDAATIEYLNKTLDDNFMEFKAFQAIDTLLTSLKDWPELERNYRRMIKRVIENDNGQLTELKFMLWSGLGEIYRSRLEQWDNAVSAFCKASEIKPREAKTHHILADLYKRMPSQEENAIEQYRILIKQGGEKLSPQEQADFYRALFILYFNTQQYDKAWCVSNITTYKGFAREDELEFNDRYLGSSVVMANGKLVPESWKYLYHPGQNMVIGNVLMLLQIHCRDIFCRKLGDWGLRKRDELEVNNDVFFWKIYQYMAGVLGTLPIPRVYFHKDQQLGMFNANLDYNAFIVGYDMMQGRSQRELGYIIARQLTLAMPQHYMASLRLPSDMLRYMMMGAIQAFSPATGNAIDKELEDIIYHIQKMPQQARMELSRIIKPIIEGKIEVNTSSWLKGVDLTANRAALLLSGDLETAIRTTRNDTAPISKLKNDEREADLVSFALSDEYFELRRRLGLSIES